MNTKEVFNYLIQKDVNIAKLLGCLDRIKDIKSIMYDNLNFNYNDLEVVENFMISTLGRKIYKLKLEEDKQNGQRN